MKKNWKTYILTIAKFLLSKNLSTKIYTEVERMSNGNDNLAMQRIAGLVDENSFMEIGSLVTARSTDFDLSNTDTPSDGVVIGHGLIDGNLVFEIGRASCRERV